jgi:hypothetical protein
VDPVLGPDLVLDGVVEAGEFHVAVALHTSADDDSMEHAGAANRIVVSWRL